MGIYVHELLAGGEARFRLVTTDKNAIRFEKVVNGGTFRQEFRVAKHFEVKTLVVGIQDSFHGGGSTHRERRLFHDNLAFVGDFQDIAGRFFPVLQVRSLTGTVTEGLGRGIHRNKDNVRFFNGCRDIGAKEEVTATGTLHHVIEAWFKNRKIVAVPGINTGLVDIDYGHLDIRTLVGNNSHSGATDIARANAKNLGIVTHSTPNLEKPHFPHPLF